MITAKMITIRLKMAEVKKIPVIAPVLTVPVPVLYILASLLDKKLLLLSVSLRMINLLAEGNIMV